MNYEKKYLKYKKKYFTIKKGGDGEIVSNISIMRNDTRETLPLQNIDIKKCNLKDLIEKIRSLLKNQFINKIIIREKELNFLDRGMKINTSIYEFIENNFTDVLIITVVIPSLTLTELIKEIIIDNFPESKQDQESFFSRRVGALEEKILKSKSLNLKKLTDEDIENIYKHIFNNNGKFKMSTSIYEMIHELIIKYIEYNKINEKSKYALKYLECKHNLVDWENIQMKDKCDHI